MCFFILKITEERELAHKEREKKQQEEILERKKQKEEDKKIEMQRLEELAKSGSTSDRINTDSSKLRQDYIKEKARIAEDEKQK